MKEETSEKLKHVKRSFRSMMNGVAAQSMRDKGTNYHVNWGVSFVDLQKMAAEYGKDYNLAIALWKENVRECKILATLVMPAEKMLPEITDLWMEQTQTQEIAEMASFNLYQHLDYAPVLAYRWIAGDRELEQLCGYLVLTRLFMRGETPDDRGIHELLDQAQAAMSGDSMAVRRSAATCLQRLSELGDDYARVVDSALKFYGLSEQP